MTLWNPSCKWSVSLTTTLSFLHILDELNRRNLLQHCYDKIRCYSAIAFTMKCITLEVLVKISLFVSWIILQLPLERTNKRGYKMLLPNHPFVSVIVLVEYVRVPIEIMTVPKILVQTRTSFRSISTTWRISNMRMMIMSRRFLMMSFLNLLKNVRIQKTNTSFWTSLRSRIFSHHEAYVWQYW